MRSVVQLVDNASVTVDNQIIARIGSGLAVLIGIEQGDTEDDVKYLVEKIINLRIFPDNMGKMNLSLLDVKGELLAVSQFTLYGDCRKGRRPSFDHAAPPNRALELYESFVVFCREQGVKVSCGKFQAEMIVQLNNHGPVTMLLDSKRIF